MLQTNLKHIETTKELEDFIAENKNAMVCCGRMGPMCLPVYAAMEKLENIEDTVAFADMDFDTPEAGIIRNLPECAGFMGLPFTVYYKDGKVIDATTSIQNLDQVQTIINKQFK